MLILLIFVYFSHVSQLSTNQIIGVTTKDVLRLNMIVRKGDKQQKLQVDKLSNDFKESVARYSSFQVVSILFFSCVSIGQFYLTKYIVFAVVFLLDVL